MQSLKSTTESIVRMVPEPEFTKTWHPVSHGKVIDSLELSLKNTGIGIVEKKYSLHGKGMDMFGTWVLDNHTNGSSWMIGLRNSMQKAFAVGICAGNYVTVCSNMIFSGEFINFRRHTAGVDEEELRRFAEVSLEGVLENITKLGIWHTGLKEFPFKEEDQFKAITFDALKEDVIPVTRFNEFVKCHEAEAKLNSPSLYTFHGGVTRMIRDNSLFNIAYSNNKLTGFCDDYIQKAA